MSAATNPSAAPTMQPHGANATTAWTDDPLTLIERVADEIRANAEYTREHIEAARPQVDVLYDEVFMTLGNADADDEHEAALPYAIACRKLRLAELDLGGIERCLDQLKGFVAKARGQREIAVPAKRTTRKRRPRRKGA